MAIIRFVHDVEVEDEHVPNRRELQRRAREGADWMQAVGTADMEGVIRGQELTAQAHVHASTEEQSCATCFYHSRDEIK